MAGELSAATRAWQERTYLAAGSPSAGSADRAEEEREQLARRELSERAKRIRPELRAQIDASVRARIERANEEEE